MLTELEDRSLALNILEPGILTLMASTCLVGNSLTCIAVYTNPRLRTSTNLYLIALAVSDIINASIVMSLAVGVLITGRWPYGETLCSFHAFFTLFSVYVSPTTMGLTAYNRYVRIVKPQAYPRIFTTARSKMYVAAIWLTVAGYVSIPKLAGWTDYGFIPGYAVCTIVHPTETMKITHYSIVVSLFFLLPLGVATVSYYEVFKTIKQHNQNMSSTIQTEDQDSRITAKEIKITKSLAIVVLAFGLCWIPFWIIAVMQRFTSDAVVPRNVQLFCTFLLFFSSTINPFIYAGMNPSFRAEFRKTLLCKARPSRAGMELKRSNDLELHQVSARVHMQNQEGEESQDKAEIVCDKHLTAE